MKGFLIIRARATSSVARQQATHAGAHFGPSGPGPGHTGAGLCKWSSASCCCTRELDRSALLEVGRHCAESANLTPRRCCREEANLHLSSVNHDLTAQAVPWSAVAGERCLDRRKVPRAGGAARARRMAAPCAAERCLPADRYGKTPLICHVLFQ